MDLCDGAEHLGLAIHLFCGKSYFHVELCAETFEPMLFFVCF